MDMESMKSIFCMIADNDEYGHRMKKHFFLKSGFTNFNHGSFGAVSRAVKSAQDQLFLEAESEPDKVCKE